MVKATYEELKSAWFNGNREDVAELLVDKDQIQMFVDYLETDMLVPDEHKLSLLYVLIRLIENIRSS